MAFKRNNNVIDSPGNSFATLNPLNAFEGTLSNGNLTVNHQGSSGKFFTSSLSVGEGKWYFEAVMKDWNSSNSRHNIGITPADTENNYSADAVPNNVMYGFFLRKTTNNTTHAASESESSGSVANGQIYQFMFDLDDNKFYVGKDGSWFNSDKHLEIIPSGHTWCVTTGAADGSNNSIHNNHFDFNFGQDHTFAGTKTDSTGHAPHGAAAGTPGLFYYEPPEGAKALCSANLSTTVENSQEHFKAVTYIGNGIDGNEVTDVGFQSDLIWIKDRDNTSQPVLVDSVRGYNKEIFSTMTKVEQTNANRGSYKSALSEINTTGFVLNSNVGPTGSTNGDGSKHIAWCWKAGGGGGKYNIDGVPYLDFANTGLTAGDITPTAMSVNTKAGFSIVKWSGNSTSNATLPTGLTDNVEFLIIKNLDSSTSWFVSMPDFNTELYLDTPASNFYPYYNISNTNNLITFGTSSNITVNNSGNYIAYCWHSVAGYSKFGSYTGNGSADGPFVYTGFRPAWVMVKGIEANNAHAWKVWNNASDPHNLSVKPLWPNLPNSEPSGLTMGIDFLSNGFKIRSNDMVENAAYKYIFMAFAEHSM